MKVSQTAIDLIKEFESFSAEAYTCPAGKLTIGYGHVVQKNEDYLNTKTLTEAEALQILTNDLKESEAYLNHICLEYDVELTQNQFDALCSFCFNLGSFTNAMLERFKAKDLTAIGNSLILYNKANGKELEGLTRRRKAEQKLFFS